MSLEEAYADLRMAAEYANNSPVIQMIEDLDRATEHVMRAGHRYDAMSERMMLITNQLQEMATHISLISSELANAAQEVN